MVTVASRVDTAHRDIIHDAQMNYHGTRLATCSSDRMIKIFELKPTGQAYPIAELVGHEGPVWQISWAHPKFDNVLASCSYDKKVIIWKEISGKWHKIYEHSQHEASVNSIIWAPYQFGLILACGSTDTNISLLTFCADSNMWNHSMVLNAHAQGCNAVSWAPAVHSTSIVTPSSTLAGKYFVSGGNDRLVKIWSECNDEWKLQQALEGHTDWVRDVAWAPAVAKGVHTIASCGQDRRVLIWRCSDIAEGKWVFRELGRFDDVLWHVSWSLCATILAVSGGDNKISLWKENIHDEWIKISDGEEEKQGISQQRGTT